MGVSSNQPSIKESLAKRAASSPSPSRELVATGGHVTKMVPGPSPRLVSDHATILAPGYPPRLVPEHAANIVQISNVKIVDEKDVVKVKTVNIKKAKNVKNDVTKNVKNVRECQTYSENGQSEVRSVCLDVVKTDDRNGQSGLSGFEANTLDMNNRKQTFTVKVKNSSRKVKVTSGQKILPTIITPTKR
jgi:hypothetical protein